jgi:hypothetical protein
MRNSEWELDVSGAMEFEVPLSWFSAEKALTSSHLSATARPRPPSRMKSWLVLSRFI